MPENGAKSENEELDDNQDFTIMHKKKKKKKKKITKWLALSSLQDCTF